MSPELEKAMREVLEAGYMMSHGRAYIRAGNDVPMEMKPKRERIVRKALALLAAEGRGGGEEEKS